MLKRQATDPAGADNGHFGGAGEDKGRA